MLLYCTSPRHVVSLLKRRKLSSVTSPFPWQREATRGPTPNWSEKSHTPKSKEPHPKNRSEKIASIQVHKYLGCRMQWGGRERAWKRSGRCQAFQATASTCDNLVWLPRMSKFHCARFRNQVLPTPARRAFTCSPGEEANGVSSPGLLSPSWPESPLPHGCRHRRLRFSPPRSCLQLCSQPFRPIKVPSSDGFAPK
jgi:hypothetical protein